MPRRKRARLLTGFTLVELLVVIGIIALLVGILLPVLNKARERGRTVSCLANLHGIIQGVMIYATENKNQLPPGFLWEHGNGATYAASTNPLDGWIAWYSCIDKEMTHGASDACETRPNAYYYGESSRVLSKVFKCPSARGDFNQQVEYYCNTVAMPWMRQEYLGAGKQAIKPAKLTQLFPDNALFWDTPLLGDNPTLTYPMFSINNTLGQPWSYIDGGQLTDPTAPELRYRSNVFNVFATTPPHTGLALQDSIFWPADNSSWFGGSLPASINVDIAGNSIYEVCLGSVRFRHNSDNAANVAFADGSARTLDIERKSLYDLSGITCYDTDFRRYMIMIKWPANKSPSGQNP